MNGNNTAISRRTALPPELTARAGKLKGRQPDGVSLEEVRRLLGGAPHRRDLLIEYLHRLSDAYGALRRRHLTALAAELNLPLAEVYEVATFYHHFEVTDSEGRAPLTVRVCGGLPCHLAGGKELLERLPAILGRELKLESVPCMGRCEQAPAASVNSSPVPFADAEKLRAAAAGAETGQPAAAANGDFTPAAFAGKALPLAEAAGLPPAYTGYAAYRAAGGYRLAAELASGGRSAESVIKALEDSGLRGLGGAGFPTGRKWRIVKDQPASKHLVVNIDEGEPGTFKDRTYLERDPHRLMEGLLIAAHTVGAQDCCIYLRGEYHGCRAVLEAELEKLKADPPFPLPPIELRRGAGAYICGEETSLLESVEGKRGEPRKRPPFIAQAGLGGRPTLENNFETLYWVRDILERGPEWFASFGRRGRKGLRSFSVSGRVKEPGVKLAPAGISVRELIDEYCGGMQNGREFYAYLPGGASGGILPASLGDLPLDFDTLQPHGCFIGSAGVIVLGAGDLARDAALNILRFFEGESCGQCTPCRAGTGKAAALMQAQSWNRAALEDLCAVMADASICGLGQAAPNPIRCVLKYFPQEVA